MNKKSQKARQDALKDIKKFLMAEKMDQKTIKTYLKMIISRFY